MRGRSEALCQTSLACFLIKRWQVVSGLFHDLDDLIERHTVVTIGERGVDIGVEGAAGSESVTLDTWYLHKSADRVAGHAEGLPPNSWHAAADAMAHATPTSP